MGYRENQKMLEEIKNVYKYMEENSDKGSLLGPVTSALMKLSMEAGNIEALNRREIEAEIGKLRTEIFQKIKEADEKLNKIAKIKEVKKNEFLL